MTTENDCPQNAKTGISAVVAIAGCLGLGQAIVFVSIPVLVDMTGLGPAALGTAVAIGTALFLVGAPYWGRQSDRRGRAPVARIAILGHGVSSLLLLASTAAALWGHIAAPVAFAGILASRIVYGLTVSGLYPTAQAWIADLTDPAGRLKAVATLSAGLSLGRIIGPMIAAAAAAIHMLGPLVALVLLAIPPLLLLNSAPDRRSARENGPVAPRLKLTDRRIAGPALFGFLLHAAFGQVQFAAGLVLETRFGLASHAASSWLGILMTAAALAMLAVQLGVMRRLKAPRPSLLIVGAGLLTAAALILATGQTMAVFAAGFIGMGTAVALLIPTYTAACSLAVSPDQRGAAAGALGVAHTCGYTVAALMGGGLYGVDPLLPFAGCALIGTVLVVIALRLGFAMPAQDQKQKQRQEQGQADGPGRQTV